MLGAVWVVGAVGGDVGGEGAGVCRHTFTAFKFKYSPNTYKRV